jgi:hypothetical protein
MSFDSKDFKVLTLTTGIDHIRVFEIENKTQDNSKFTDTQKSLDMERALT